MVAMSAHDLDLVAKSLPAVTVTALENLHRGLAVLGMRCSPHERTHV